jgi:hypothetical protein
LAISTYINGAGGTSGADLACLPRLNASGVFWFVGNAVVGASDANPGSDRQRPLVTTAQAYANASAGDTLVYLENHRETISSSVTLGKTGLSLVGEGIGDAVPRLTVAATIAMLDITAADVLIDNLYFPAATAAPTAKIRVGAAGAILNDLVFDCGASDSGPGVAYVTGGTSSKLSGCRFVATAAAPAAAITVANAISGLTIDGLTLDAGAYEWTTGYAFYATAAITRLRATRVYQLNGSDVILPTGTTGIWQTQSATGNSRVNWTP